MNAQTQAGQIPSTSAASGGSVACSADSAPYFLSAITSDPGGEPATQAAILILDSLTLVEDWENLYTYSKAFYEQPDLGDDDFKNQVWEVHKEANRNLK
jgi:hypothetical protein